MTKTEVLIVVERNVDGQTSVKTFDALTDSGRAEDLFKRLVSTQDSSLDDEEVEDILFDGYYENIDGYELSLIWSEVE